jgi:site-specific recombinase XerD
MASLYRRGKVWWAKSYRNGKMIRQSLRTESKAEAKRRLKKMGHQTTSEVPTSPRMLTATWDTAAQDLLAYYRAFNTRDPVNASYRVEHLTRYLGNMKLADIDSAVITGYVHHRLKTGRAAATINVELATLRRALKLQVEYGKLDRVPTIRMLRPAPPRSGFFERRQFEMVCRALPEDLALIARIGYTFGWRLKSEVQTLSRAQVNLAEGTLRLKPGTTKNKAGRLVYMPDELTVAIAAQLARVEHLERQLGRSIPWLFPWLSGHYKGERIKSFTYTWRKACLIAGCPEMLRHDLRRSAARNMVSLGVPERVVMAVGGWKTSSMLHRYCIVSPGDLQDVARRLTGTVLGTPPLR